MTNEHIEMLTKFAKFGEASRKHGLTEEYTRISEKLAQKTVEPQVLQDLSEFMKKIEQLTNKEPPERQPYISFDNWMKMRQAYSATQPTTSEQDTISIRSALAQSTSPIKKGVIAPNALNLYKAASANKPEKQADANSQPKPQSSASKHNKKQAPFAKGLNRLV